MSKRYGCSTSALYRHCLRCFERLRDHMEGLGASALRYGWDMPTASMLYPHAYRAYYRSRAEFNRRFKASGLSVSEFKAANGIGDGL